MDERGTVRTFATERRLGLRLFAVSFVALFLELMMIRWAPSVVRLVAYYGNLMLISSFLGLGIGALLSTRRDRLLGWFPILLALEIATLVLASRAVLPTSGSEERFFAPLAASRLPSYVVLVGIFAANALTFVPLGDEIGSLFRTLPPLSAYKWDLLGSLCGTACFGAFSFSFFSPPVGMAAVGGLFLSLRPRRLLVPGLVSFLAIGALLIAANDRASMWSPYYYVSIGEAYLRPDGTVGQSGPAEVPPDQLRAMKDPPMYAVTVNQDFYQFDGTIDLSRYTTGSRMRVIPEVLRSSYLLPYEICRGRKRVAVLGAGGGIDVEAALLSGVEHVDAVEIDPLLVRLSKRFAASAVYGDPRVSIHVDDARSFIHNAAPGYDLVVFGYLDSQALFSYMSNIRLDGFVYTVESLRSAFRLLNEDGALVLSFGAPVPWLATKLLGMVIEATGRRPIVYFGSPGHAVVLIVPRGDHAPLPARWAALQHVSLGERDVHIRAVDLATDDWPYLYLARRTIPSDYLLVVGVLLGASVAAVLAIRGSRFGLQDGHFFFLGMGFLLLETHAITDFSLYFGATWLVTTLVVSGVLIMVLIANGAAVRIRRFSLGLYAPLLATLFAIYFAPREWVLGLPFAGRIAWTFASVPLAVFFAGLVFSSTFRAAPEPSVLLGANLIGAMVGGFSEYLGMAIGSRSLVLLVIATYLCSLLCQLALRDREAMRTAGHLEPPGDDRALRRQSAANTGGASLST